MFFGPGRVLPIGKNRSGGSGRHGETAFNQFGIWNIGEVLEVL